MLLADRNRSLDNKCLKFNGFTVANVLEEIIVDTLIITKPVGKINFPPASRFSLKAFNLMTNKYKWMQSASFNHYYFTLFAKLLSEFYFWSKKVLSKVSKSIIGCIMHWPFACPFNSVNMIVVCLFCLIKMANKPTYHIEHNLPVEPVTVKYYMVLIYKPGIIWAIYCSTF